jgi:hypothetical protein
LQADYDLRLARFEAEKRIAQEVEPINLPALAAA